MDNSRVVDYVKQVNDKTEYVRRPAAEALGNIGAPSVSALIEVLKDQNKGVHWRVQEALAQLGSRAVPALIDALKDKAWHVRWHAALALREIADASAVPALIEALKDSDPDVRWGAAEALGAIGDAAAVPALIVALKDIKSSVRNDAAIALGKIGDASAVPALIEALKDPSEGVRRCAAEGLQKIGDSKTLPRKILAASQLPIQVRIEILDALRPIRYKDRYPNLVRYPILHYNFPETRALCQMVLDEGDAGASAEAQAALNWLDANPLDARQLDDTQHAVVTVPDVAASAQQEPIHASQEATSPSRSEPALRGTDTPPKSAEHSSQQPTLGQRVGAFFGRLFGKRKAAVK
jgi:HEAT repeat protein